MVTLSICDKLRIIIVSVVFIFGMSSFSPAQEQRQQYAPLPDLQIIGEVTTSALDAIEILDDTITETINLALGFDRRIGVLSEVSQRELGAVLDLSARTESIRATARIVAESPVVRSLNRLDTAATLGWAASDSFQSVSGWVSEGTTTAGALEDISRNVRTVYQLVPVAALAEVALVSPVERSFSEFSRDLQYNWSGLESFANYIDVLSSTEHMAYFVALNMQGGEFDEVSATRRGGLAFDQYADRLVLLLGEIEGYIIEVEQEKEELGVCILRSCRDVQDAYDSWIGYLNNSISRVESIISSTDTLVMFEVMALAYAQDIAGEVIENSINEIEEGADILFNELERLPPRDEIAEGLLDGDSPSDPINNADIDLSNENATEIGNTDIAMVDPDPTPIDPDPTPVDPDPTPIDPDPTPVGPDPTEIQQNAADLLAARDTLSLTQQDVQARLNSAQNHLTLLQFGDLEEVNNALSEAGTNIQTLRDAIADPSYSTSEREAFQTRLQDYLSYQEDLEAENERILAEIATVEESITIFTEALDAATAALADTAANAVALDETREDAVNAGLTDVVSDIDGWTPPAFTPVDIPDWSDYEYVLPPLDLTPLGGPIFGHLAFGQFGTSTSSGPSRRLVSRAGSSGLIVTNVDGEVTHFVIEDDNGTDVQIVPTEERTASSFQYLSWGVTRVPFDWYDDSLGQTLEIESSYWVYGDPTPASAFQNRTGTAWYEGDIYGDLILGDERFDIASGTYTDAVTGSLQFQVDFADDSVAGNGVFNIAAVDADMLPITEYFAMEGSFYEQSEGSLSVTGASGDLQGNNGTGGLFTSFYGPGGEEFGGTIYYFGDSHDGLSYGVTGVVVGDEGSAPSYPLNLRGLAAYEYLSGTTSVLGFASVESVADTGEITFTNNLSDSFSGEVEFTAETGSTSYAVPSSESDSSSYSYVTWGGWDNPNYNGGFTVYGEYRVDRSGQWIVYEPTTDLPTSGSAIYNGVVSSSTGHQGTISMNADFGNDAISGNMDVNLANGSDWADATFDTSITRSSGGAGFQGVLIGSDVNNGVLFGGFAGPAGAEAAGGWEIQHIDGSSANGIFRAQQ